MTFVTPAEFKNLTVVEDPDVGVYVTACDPDVLTLNLSVLVYPVEFILSNSYFTFPPLV